MKTKLLSFVLPIAALVCLALFPVCKSEGENPHEYPVLQFSGRIVNNAASDVTEVALMFVDKEVGRIKPGEPYEWTESLGESQSTAFSSNEHIEYTIGDVRFDRRVEQGEFAGKPIVIGGGGKVVITIFDTYYRLEVLGP